MEQMIATLMEQLAEIQRNQLAVKRDIGALVAWRDHQNSVEITFRRERWLELSETLQDIDVRLRSLESFRAAEGDAWERTEQLSQRLRRVEDFKLKLVTAAAVGGAGGSLLTQRLIALFTTGGG